MELAYTPILQTTPFCFSLSQTHSKHKHALSNSVQSTVEYQRWSRNSIQAINKSKESVRTKVKMATPGQEQKAAVNMEQINLDDTNDYASLLQGCAQTKALLRGQQVRGHFHQPSVSLCKIMETWSMQTNCLKKFLTEFFD